MVAKLMVLFTNRNCLIFDEAGDQVPELQGSISCSHLDKDIALQATMEATEFHISKRTIWGHKITREEMQWLLGVHP